MTIVGILCPSSPPILLLGFHGAVRDFSERVSEPRGTGFEFLVIKIYKI